MIEKILNKLFKHKLIVNCEKQGYLHRWYIIKTNLLGIFIHQFIRSDEDRAVHDHPWNFIVIPLYRGYNEYSDKGKRRVYPILGTRFRFATYKHRVDLIDNKSAWSLFIRFKKVRDWGFWPSEGFTLWNKWIKDRCE